MSLNPSFSELRQHAGMTVEEAADELGYSARTVRNDAVGSWRLH